MHLVQFAAKANLKSSSQAVVSTDEPGRMDEADREIHRILSRLRAHLEDVRSQLLERGPNWYDEEQDARFDASLALLDQLDARTEAGPGRTS